ncbi:MAG: protein jag [Candidatus Hydrogenedentes bacterium]|nr:protein jag [Candidatus Hydrogenedentota bacterium]
MESIETQGKTVEAAVESALDALGVGRDDVDIEVLDEGHGGLFGLGGSPAAVRVTVRRDTVRADQQTVTENDTENVEVEDNGECDAEDDYAGDEPEDVLATLLDLMNIEGTIERTDHDDDVLLEIDSDDAALLIGRRGKCLNSLQFMVNRIVRRQEGFKRRVIVDVEGYRERRRESLTEMAERMAAKSCQSGKEVHLQPLDPQDRRTIHIALRDYPGVDTYSVGEGSYRAVVISPDKVRRQDEQ